MTQAVKFESIRRDYKSLAENYEKRWAGFIEEAHGWVLEHLNAPQGVIDVGCGTGHLLSLINEQYPDAGLTGLDGTPEMLAIAGNNVPQAMFREIDLARIDIKGQFDSVFSVNVLHHLNDPEAHIGLLHSLCADNGAVFLCDFAIESLPLKLAEQYWRAFHPAHHKSFSRKELRGILSPYFTVEKEETLKPDKFWCLQIYKLRKS